MNDRVIYEYESGHKTRLSTLISAMALLTAAGEDGMTARDMGEKIWPGDTSGKSRAGGVLTRLHKEARIAALEDKREGHHIYVRREFVRGRSTWSGYRHHGHCETCTCFDNEENQ